MLSRAIKNKIWIHSSIIFVILLDTYLFPETIIQWKPLLVLLTLIYWNVALPDKVGIFEALLFGLILDLLNGSVLGLNGLMFVLITYICQRFFYQFRVSPVWQQSVILFFLFFIYKMAFAFDFYDITVGINVSDSLYLLHTTIFALASSIFWIPSFYILREFRRRKIKI